LALSEMNGPQQNPYSEEPSLKTRSHEIRSESAPIMQQSGSKKLVPILANANRSYANKLAMVKVKPTTVLRMHHNNNNNNSIAASNSLNFSSSSSNDENRSIEPAESQRNMAKSKGVRFSEQVIILNQLDFLPMSMRSSESCLKIPNIYRDATYTVIDKRPMKI
jgi:hypothetical protein